MTKENKVLKRMSQRLMPLMPTLPEDSAAVTVDLSADLSTQCADAVDGGEDDSGEEGLQEQAQIAGKFRQKHLIRLIICCDDGRVFCIQADPCLER